MEYRKTSKEAAEQRAKARVQAQQKANFPYAVVREEESQTEDRGWKMAAEFFGNEMLRFFNIEGNIREVFPTELNFASFNRMFQDFNYLMEDDSCCHIEFESDRVRREDLKRFRVYEAVTSYVYQKPVTTHVICSANVKEPVSEFEEGINTYRVNLIRMKDGNADEVFFKIREKKPEDVTKDDLFAVMLSPLMSGEMNVKTRIEEGFVFLKKEYPGISSEDLERMQAVLYLFALKFLGRVEVENMEVLRMTYFAKMMMDEGKAIGKKEGELNHLFKLISRKLNRGKAPEAIAEEVEEDILVVQKICDFIKAHENDSEADLAALYLAAVA